MKGGRRTKKQLLDEMALMNRRTARLEKSRTEGSGMEDVPNRHEDRYQGLYDNTPAMLHSIDKDGRLVNVSNHWLDVLGYKKSEVIGRKLTDFMTDASKRDAQETNIPTFFKQGFIKDVFYRFVKKNGEIIDVLLSATSERDTDGNPVRSVSIMNDITERIRAAQLLKTAEEKFQNIFKNAVEGIYQSTPEGQYLEVNPAFARIFGYDSPEELKNTVKDNRQLYVDPQERRECIQILEKQGTGYFEVQVRTKDGSTKWVSNNVRAIRNDEGRMTRFEGFVEDITDRKHAEEALKESEERYRMAIEHSNDAVGIIRTNQRIFLSRKYMEMVGYTAEELAEKPFLFSLHPDDREKARELTRRRLSGDPVPPKHEWRLIRKDGSVVLVETSTAVIMYDGEPASLCYVRDITERKNMEDELRRSSNELRLLAARLEKIREEERARVALEIHDELGQLLTAMKLGIAWLKQKIPERQSSLRKKADTIIADADAAVKLVRRISTGLRPPVLDDFGLEAAIEWLTNDFQNRTGITCILTSSLKGADLDRDKSASIFRFVQECLTNALRHAAASMISVKFQEKDGRLTVRVEDNGRGITKEEILNRESLGLTGMKERALSLDGRFGIHGVPGKGTVVTLSIPLP